MENKILLIEDSKLVQQIYKNKLLLEKFEVVTADNGMEGVRILSKEVPDLILLDLMMPVMDGYKVLQMVKTDLRLKEIPVIVFSTRGQAGEVEKALKLGASDYIIKATTKPDQVVERIRKLLSEREKIKELTHYRLRIDASSPDASRLSTYLGSDNLKCNVCSSTLILDLIPDFSEETNWFSGKFICPKCEEGTNPVK